jgi:dipeptidyl aminopeptidase/acylaminoacyl peptidase
MLNLADLLRVPQVDTGLPFGISPDGQKVAFSWNMTANWELYELDLSSHERGDAAKQITSGAGGKFAPRYSPNGKYLAYALDPDGNESYHIVLHDLQTSVQIDLTLDIAYAHQPNFSFSPDGKELAILSDEHGQFALYLLSLELSEKQLMLDIQHPIWDVSWSPDGRWIVVEVEMQASDRGIFIVEVKTGTWRQIEADGKILNAQHPAWSPDSKFLAFSAESGEWFDVGVYEMDHCKVHWLTEDNGDNTSPCWSEDGKRIGWIHAEGAATSLIIRESSGHTRQYQLPNGVHYLPRFTPRGEVIFLFASPKQPPDLWKLNPDGTFDQLTNSLPDELRDTEFAMPDEISYESDHLSVPALLYRGDGSRAVVSIHGGPNWHMQFIWDPLIAHMASRGWTVLTPNYRGSTGYGRAWQIASRFDMGGVDTRDCAAGVDYLLRERLTASDKVAVTGRSHGGYLVMTCLTQFPELWCGGSAVVPFMNWFKSHEDSREDLQHWNIENMGDPTENYERWYNASPYFFLDQVHAPVQLICGGNDPRCPASDSLEARDKLVTLGKDVELLLVEEEGHSFLKIENVIDSETRRVEFLARVLE